MANRTNRSNPLSSKPRAGFPVHIFIWPVVAFGAAWVLGTWSGLGWPLPAGAAVLAAGTVVAARRIRWNAPGDEAETSAGDGEPTASPDGALLRRMLALFAELTDRESLSSGPAGGFPDGIRGARALARTAPLLLGSDPGNTPSEVTYRPFDPGLLLENACRDWASCAAARGLDVQGFVIPASPASCFGDAVRTGRLIDLVLLAGCFGLQSGIVRVRVEVGDGSEGLRIALQVRGYPEDADWPGPLRSALESRARGLGGRLSTGDLAGEGTCLVELPFDLEDRQRTPSRHLEGVALHVSGRSVLGEVMEAYLAAEGALIVDEPGDASAILVAEPARDPETDTRCQSLKRAHPGIPVLCQGATPGAPASLMLEADALIPVPFARGELARLVLQHLDAADPRDRRRPVPHASDPEGPRPNRPVRADGPAGGVLVAEDDAISARVVTRFLEAEGFRVHQVRDGDAALETLKRGTPDLALLDMHMPGLSGVEVAKRYRHWEREQGRARIPLLALTASSAEEDRRACRESGMDDFLSKPVEREALRGLLERFGVEASAEEKRI